MQAELKLPIIYSRVRVCMLEIQRVDDESAGQLESIAHPETGTVEIRQQELVRIGIEGIGVFDAGHQVLQLRTDERVPGVSGIHVKPDLGEKLFLVSYGDARRTSDRQ